MGAKADALDPPFDLESTSFDGSGGGVHGEPLGCVSRQRSFEREELCAALSHVTRSLVARSVSRAAR
jgi:hypothetical protein